MWLEQTPRISIGSTGRNSRRSCVNSCDAFRERASVQWGLTRARRPHLSRIYLLCRVLLPRCNLVLDSFSFRFVCDSIVIAFGPFLFSFRFVFDSVTLCLIFGFFGFACNSVFVPFSVSVFRFRGETLQDKMRRSAQHLRVLHATMCTPCVNRYNWTLLK